MRALVVLAALSLLWVPGAPPVAAHGDGINHGAVFSGTLAPSEQVTKHLDYEEGPLVGGWVFMVGARVEGGPLAIDLVLLADVVATWSFAPTSGSVRTMMLPQTGNYNFTFRNEGSATVNYWVYFDQSCNCLGKFIPAEIPTGMIIFNFDTSGPGTLFAQFNEPSVMKVRVTASLMTSTRASWPGDFRTLAVSNAPVKRQVEGLPPVWLHELEFPVPRKERVFFFVEGVSFDSANYTSSGDLYITPGYKETASSGSVPVLLVAAAAGFAIAGGLILRRVRRAPAVAAGRSKQAFSFKKHPGRKGQKVKSHRRGAARDGRHRRTSKPRRRRS